MTIDEIRERICIALRVPLDTPDWLERCEHTLHGAWNWKEKRRGKPYDRTTLGGRVRMAREIAGLTQAQLAARLGVYKCNVWGWEHGTQDMPSEKLGPLCLIVGVSRPWMLGESEEGGPPLPVEVLRAAYAPSFLAYNRSQKQYAQKRDKAKRLLARIQAERDELKKSLPESE